MTSMVYLVPFSDVWGGRKKLYFYFVPKSSKNILMKSVLF